MLQTIDSEGVRGLRLARPPVNALDTALIETLAAAVEVAPAIGARARAIGLDIMA